MIRPLVGVLALAGMARAIPPDAGPSSRPVSAPAAAPQEIRVRIRIRLDDALITATLDDTPVARDFARLLPFEVRLRDYAQTEAIGDPPRRLQIAGAPAGYTPSAGDLTYYAPWGNLALFYRGFGHAKGLVRLGRIDTGLAHLRGLDGTKRARFERIEPAP